MAYWDWYWACEDQEPALDRFVIAQGQSALWRRVRREIRNDEAVSWMAINKPGCEVTIEDILQLLMVEVRSYHMNHNKFAIEAAQIPVFARFLFEGRSILANYVSNVSFPDAMIRYEPYSDAATDALGREVSATLGRDDVWWEYQ